MTVLADAFPSEKSRVEGYITEAGMSLFVHERGGLQRADATHRPQLTMGDDAQLLIHERNEPVERLVLSAAEFGEDVGRRH